MSEYTWTAEEREVTALKRIVKTGETFETSPALGEQLVAQGLAKPNTKPTKKKTAAVDPAED